jgi:hypothetical protein
MLSGIIAYQVLQQENPKSIEKVKTVLEKHPWYANQWQARFVDVPVADRDLVLFMQDLHVHSIVTASTRRETFSNDLAF